MDFGGDALGFVVSEQTFAEERFKKFKEGNLSDEMKVILSKHSGNFILKKK